MLDRHPETSQQRHRLWIAAGAFANPDWSVLNRDAGHRPGVVGHHGIAARLGDNEHLRGSGGVCLAGVVTQPLRLLGRPALEDIDDVIGLESLRDLIEIYDGEIAELDRRIYGDFATTPGIEQSTVEWGGSGACGSVCR